LTVGRSSHPAIELTLDSHWTGQFDLTRIRACEHTSPCSTVYWLFGWSRSRRDAPLSTRPPRVAA